MPKIQMRRDTAANWKSENPTLLAGEWALETDTKKMKVGDGSTAYNSLEYFREEDNEWEKPADWPDIRSGALPNSVYFLVGVDNSHTEFGYVANTDDSSTYDVYVDGSKYATVANSTAFRVDFSEVNYEPIGTTVTPSACDLHIIRITPTNSSSHFSWLRGTTANMTNPMEQNVLWIHVTITNQCAYLHFAGAETYRFAYPNLIAVTSATGELSVKYEDPVNLTACFRGCKKLKEVPIINGNNGVANGYQFARETYELRKLRLKNFQRIGGSGFISENSALTHIYTENAFVDFTSYQWEPFVVGNNLDSFPPQTSVYESNIYIHNLPNVCPTFMDLSHEETMKYVYFNQINGIKGITVSPDAPFDSTAVAQQISVQNLGLDRGALVNLFESMPYNVGYTVVGAPVFDGGVVSGFSSSNYLKLNKAIDDTVKANTLEIYTKITTSSSHPTSSGIICRDDWHSTGLHMSSGKVGATIIDYHPDEETASTGYSVYSELKLSTNTTYFIRYIYNKEEGTLLVGYSSDGITWVDSIRDDIPTTLHLPAGGHILIGRYVGGIWNGSIDLANTYIKVNGVPWFRGFCKNMVPGGTLVGSPTVTDGVLSNCSSSKYLTTTPNLNTLASASSWTLVHRVKRTSNITSLSIFSGNIGGWLSSIGITNNKLRLGLFDGETQVAVCVGTTTLDLNTYYWVKVEFTGSVYNLYLSSDGVTYNLENSVTNSAPFKQQGNWQLGFVYTSAFAGTIDLNNCYAIADGVKVWDGMVPQVKTVNVKGCTGTPDISGSSAQARADRNIVLDKGWELTYQ